MRKCDKLGYNGRVERLTPIITESFSIPAMTSWRFGRAGPAE